MKLWRRLDDKHAVCFEDMILHRYTETGFERFKLERDICVLGYGLWKTRDDDGNLLVMLLFQTKLELMYLSWVTERMLLE